jgi:hypothetical protein
MQLDLPEGPRIVAEDENFNAVPQVSHDCITHWVVFAGPEEWEPIFIGESRGECEAFVSDMPEVAA